MLARERSEQPDGKASVSDRVSLLFDPGVCCAPRTAACCARVQALSSAGAHQRDLAFGTAPLRCGRAVDGLLFPCRSFTHGLRLLSALPFFFLAAGYSCPSRARPTFVSSSDFLRGDDLFASSICQQRVGLSVRHVIGCFAANHGFQQGEQV